MAKARRGRSGGKKPVARKAESRDEPTIMFNHAMVYSTDLGRALKFYVGGLGLQAIEEIAHEGRLVYARLCSRGSDSTIALHSLEPGTRVPEGERVRLYFEAKDLEALCEKLQQQGFALEGPPKVEPWGWKHAYLRDPDGHELSLYRAGRRRLRRMRVRK